MPCHAPFNQEAFSKTCAEFRVQGHQAFANALEMRAEAIKNVPVDDAYIRLADGESHFGHLDALVLLYGYPGSWFTVGGEGAVKEHGAVKIVTFMPKHECEPKHVCAGVSGPDGEKKKRDEEKQKEPIGEEKGEFKKQDIHGDVVGDVHGTVHGDVKGHVNGDVVGDVKGSVWGDIKGDVKGDVHGSILGSVQRGTVQQDEELEAMNRRVDALKAAVDNLMADNEDLRDHNQGLKSAVSDLQAENQELKEQHDELVSHLAASEKQTRSQAASPVHYQALNSINVTDGFKPSTAPSPVENQSTCINDTDGSNDAPAARLNDLISFNTTTSGPSKPHSRKFSATNSFKSSKSASKDHDKFSVKSSDTRASKSKMKKVEKIADRIVFGRPKPLSRHNSYSSSTNGAASPLASKAASVFAIPEEKVPQATTPKAQSVLSIPEETEDDGFTEIEERFVAAMPDIEKGVMDLKAENSKLKSRIASLEQENSSAKDTLLEAELANTALSTNIIELEDTVKNLKTTCSKQITKTSSLAADIKKKDAEIEDLKTSFSNLNEFVNLLKADLESQKTKVNELEKEKEWAEMNAKSMQDDVQELWGKTKAKDAELRRVRGVVEEVRKLVVDESERPISDDSD